MIHLSTTSTPDILVAALGSLAGATNASLRLVLAGVTLVSGVGKLLDPVGSRQAMGDFGVPARYVESFARALPVAEMVLSAAVLVDLTSRPACAGLALLFIAFCFGIGNLLRQDKAPPCNCFGAVHSEPVSAATLVRAMVLAALSAVCFYLPVYPLTPNFKMFGLALIGYAVSAYLVRFSVRRRQRRERTKPLNRLQVGQRLPAVRLTSGQWLEDVLPEDRPTLLILTSPGCGPCRGLKLWLKGWAANVEESLAVMELETALPGKEAEEGEPPPYAFHSFDAKEAARFKSATPGAFLVDGRGTLKATPVAGQAEIEALVRLALRENGR